MCGIVAIANGPIKVGPDWITQALYADAVRGWDSTGLIAVREGKASYYKRALSAPDFIRTRVFQRMVQTSAQAFIGHNRAATIGKVTDETAHPFQFDHITGVHNGTLDFGWRDTLDGDGFDVDSEALIYNIAKNGIEETVKKAHGAFAILYHDARDNTLNVIRNDERPMYYGRMDWKEDRWVFGSEAGLIEWITERTDNDRLTEVWELKVGKLLTLNLTTNEMSSRDIEVAGRSTKSYGPFTAKTYYGKAAKKNTKSSGQVGDTTRPPNVVMLPHERKLFEEMNVDVNERMEFWATSWTPYSNHMDQGTLRGCMCDDPYMEVVLYGIRKGEVNMSMAYSSYPINVRRKTGVQKDIKQSTDDDLEIVLSAAHLLEIVDATVEVVNDDQPEENDNETPWLLDDKRPLGPHGERLSHVEFDKLTSKGCSCCNANITYGLDSVHWTLDGQPLCNDCNILLAYDAVGGY